MSTLHRFFVHIILIKSIVLISFTNDLIAERDLEKIKALNYSSSRVKEIKKTFTLEKHLGYRSANNYRHKGAHILNMPHQQINIRKRQSRLEAQGNSGKSQLVHPRRTSERNAPESKKSRSKNVETPSNANNSLALNGVDDFARASSIVFPTTGQLTNFTVEAWIFPKGTSNGIIVADSTYDLVLIHLENGEIEILFNLFQSETNTIIRETRDVQLNEWNHVAAIVDAESKEIRLAINGKLSPQPTAFPGTSFDIVPSFLFTVGALSSDPTSTLFNGNIDEIRISNSIRYTTDFTPGTELEADGQTVALYHFNDATGSTEFNDSSSNDFTLTGGNGAQTTGDSVENRAPTISVIADRIIEVNTATGELPFTIQDADTPSENLILTVRSSNTDLAPTENITFGGTGTNRTVSVTPVADQSGSTLITVTVGDGQGSTAESLFIVGVKPASTATDNFLQLDGVDDFAQALSPVFPTTSEFTSFTIEAWVFPEENGINTIVSSATFDLAVIFDSQETQNSGLAIDFTLVHDETITRKREFRDIQLNTWNHVAVMFSAESKEIQIGINGKLSPEPTLVGGDTFLLDGNFTVGVFILDLTSFLFAGSIDEIRLSDIIRYTTDFTPNQEFENDENTIALYHFNEPVGSTVFNDSSSNDYALVGFSDATIMTNRAPTLSTITDQIIEVNTSTGELTLTLQDAETPPENLILTGISSNTDLVPNGNITFGGSGTNRTVNITPVQGQSGSTEITITVSDPQGNSADTGFVLVIKPASTANDNFLHLDGVDDFAQALSPIFPTSNDFRSFTVEAWIFPIEEKDFGSILSGSAFDLVFISDPSQAQNSGLGITFALVHDGTSTAKTEFREVQLNTWNHVAAMFNAETQEIQIAINGKLSAQSTAVTGNAFDLFSVFTIGALNVNPSLDLFPGNIEEVRISNSVRYTADFTPSIELKADDQTVTLYHFDEPIGSTVFNDSSSNDFVLIGSNGAAIEADSVNNTPPTGSDIANQAIAANTSTGELAFTVEDTETQAENLTITASSSNTQLVPNENIVLGGFGTERTVLATPAMDQFGSTMITLTVTDDAAPPASSTIIFLLEVNDAPAAIEDTDEDGLDDNWEREHFDGLQLDGDSNPDMDRLTNLQEFKVDRDPNEADTNLDVLDVVEGWNLISIPDGVENATLDSLFGGRFMGTVWTWADGHFEIVEENGILGYKNGYWINFVGNFTIPIPLVP